MSEQKSSIILEYSSRRPSAEAWSARSDGHITYAPTREEALSRHKAMLAAYSRMLRSLQRCAGQSLTVPK